MSVVSEKSHRRNFAQFAPYGRNGFSSSRSAVEVDYLLPRFSAVTSECMKGDYGRDDENTTVVTGATSENSYGGAYGNDGNAVSLDNNIATMRISAGRRCANIIWRIFVISLASISLLSPPAMIIAPFLLGNLPPFLASLSARLSNNAISSIISDVTTSQSTTIEYDWPPVQCEVDCQGGLLNMVGKLVLLLLTFYVLFGRCAYATLPRLDITRTLFIFLTLFSIFAFWLFYVVRILIESDFRSFVPFAQYLVDLLLFINCIHAFYELRQLRIVYSVTIVRDPDGESHTLQLGQMTIQNAAINILRFYHTEFSTFNPFLDGTRQAAILGGPGNGGGRFGSGGGRFSGNASNFRSSGPAGSGFKFYDIEERAGIAGGVGPGAEKRNNVALPEANVRVLLEASARRRMAAHNNDVLYAEDEYERRLSKRRCRLVGCAEEVFAYVQALNENSVNNRTEPMNPKVAAETVMAGLNKPLMRYIKYTRQAPYQSRSHMLAHLEKCLAYGFSARTFLQRFFGKRLPPMNGTTLSNSSSTVESGKQVAKNTLEKDEWSIPLSESKWSLLCTQQASGELRHGVQFVLRSHAVRGTTDAGVQLHCIVSSFPFYNLTEQCAMEKKYVLRAA